MNEAEYEQTLRADGHRAHSYAVWLLGNAEEAADVVQEAFVRLWAGRQGVQARAGRVWLLRTIYRLGVDRHRRRVVRRELPLAGDDPGATTSGSLADLPAMQSETRKAVAEALATLSPRDRALVVMREMQDMPYQEMSSVLDLPINTLKPALYRARERLRSALTAAGVRP